jgi:ribosomal protein S18 acetylase RimI-like enzyme
MLYEAAAWRTTCPSPSIDSLLSDAKIRIYIEGWGREGDGGVIGQIDGLVGAAWYRLYTDAVHGYGFIDAAIPELTIAVAPSHRRCGVGTALLDALIEQAERSGFLALSLSVEHDNRAAISLYEPLGFEKVESVGNAWTMYLDLSARAKKPPHRF